MCGIIGCVMRQDCKDTLYTILSLLEYRGYDSVGVAVLQDKDKSMQIAKNIGGIESIQLHNLSGRVGIGHTRWATHGEVSIANAHPHCSENFALVHNGIIENYLALKKEYLQDVKFASSTDSEVLVYLIEKHYQALLEKGELENIFVNAVQLALQKVQGSYAIAVLSRKFSNQLVASRSKCPLLIAKGENEEVYVCSDIQAISANATVFANLHEKEVVHLQAEKVLFYNATGRQIERKFKPILHRQQQLLKPRCSYMEKEILEIPTALQNCLTALNKMNFTKLMQLFQRINAIHVVACGTSYHAGLVFQNLLQRYSTIEVNVHLASEIYKGKKNIQKGELVIVLSQSGETADSLEAVKLLKKQGCIILSITNTQYSSLAELSHYTIWMQAGQEIAVAATKTYVCQLFVLYAILEKLLVAREEKVPKFLKQLHKLPNLVKKVYVDFDKIDQLAKQMQKQQAMAVIGRDIDVATAKEIALKIKEITYVFAEAYPAGELKHGSLALIDKDFCVLAIATQKKLFPKIENALLEIKSRRGKTILCSPYPSDIADFSIQIPQLDENFMPIFAVIPLQYFACKLSEARKINPDKPKNLAKSVTVE